MLFQPSLDIRIVRIDEHGDYTSGRHQFAQQLQPFRNKSATEICNSRQVSRRAIEVSYKAFGDWVAAREEYNGDCCRGSLGGDCRGKAIRENHSHPAANEVSGQHRQLIVLLCRMEFDRYVLAFEVALCIQSLAQLRQTSWVYGCRTAQISNGGQPLLRACRERPASRRAAEKGDELAPFHANFATC
jgi:hypothetical protein